MEGALPLGAVSCVLGTAVGITQKAFEISAVDEQARSLLKTVEQVSCELKEARVLRRQKSSLFTITEKRMFDDTFQRTDEAMSLVAALAEPARADIEVSGGRVRFKTRVLFLMRDSPRISVCLTQLGIASQSLSRVIGTLCSREGRAAIHTSVDCNSARKAPPPTYEETMFMSEQRRRNLRRRASALSADNRSLSHSLMPSPRSHVQLPPGNIAELPVMEISEHISELAASQRSSTISDGSVEDLTVPGSRQWPNDYMSESSVESGTSGPLNHGTRGRNGRVRSRQWLETHS